MRKLMFLMLMISGLSMACGDSGTADEKPSTEDPATADDGETGGDNGATDSDDATGGNGGSAVIGIPDAGSAGGEEPVLYPECPREMIPAMFPAFDGEKSLTMTGYQACNTMCGQDQACYVDANCPGVEAFNECLNTEVVGCSASADGMCRKEYENFVCCADAAGCAPDDSACAMTNCASEISKVGPCVQGDTGCIQQGGGKCFAAEPAGGTEPEPTPAPGGMTIPAATLSQMLRSLNALR